MHMSQQPKPRRDEIGVKVRRTLSLDKDVDEKLEDIAAAQRDSVSGMANRMLAVTLGLTPRQEDSQWRPSTK